MGLNAPYYTNSEPKLCDVVTAELSKARKWVGENAKLRARTTEKCCNKERYKHCIVTDTWCCGSVCLGLRQKRKMGAYVQVPS